MRTRQLGCAHVPSQAHVPRRGSTAITVRVRRCTVRHSAAALMVFPPHPARGLHTPEAAMPTCKRKPEAEDATLGL